MECPHCAAPTVVVPLAPDLRAFAATDSDAVVVCTTCLRQFETDEIGEGDPDLDAISDALPGDPRAAVPILLLVGLLDSLATNREAIEALVEAAEAAGADPLLALDRLAEDDALDPAVDLGRRRHQLEQLL